LVSIATYTRTIYETIVKALTACIEGAQRHGDIAAPPTPANWRRSSSGRNVAPRGRRRYRGASH